MRRRMTILAMSTAVTMGMLTSCASAPIVATTATGTSGLATRPVGADEDSAAGLLQGKIVYENGCLRLDDGTVPIFPEAEAIWDGTTLTWNGTDYVVGQKIILGGGEATADQSSSLIPEACGEGHAWIVATEG